MQHEAAARLDGGVLDSLAQCCPPREVNGCWHGPLVTHSDPAIEISERMALMYAEKSSACAVASLRRVSRTPHVLVGKNRKKERL